LPGRSGAHNVHRACDTGWERSTDDANVAAPPARRRSIITALIAILLSVSTTGCTTTGEDPVRNLTETAETPYITTPTGQPVTAIAGVLDRNRDRLLGIDGVEGVGIGRDSAGHDILVVYVRDSATIQRLPVQIEGYPVHAEVTGPVTPR
jgi:hypothetical protein